jgi:deoxyribodipyrimidine photo-lyase
MEPTVLRFALRTRPQSFGRKDIKTQNARKVNNSIYNQSDSTTFPKNADNLSNARNAQMTDGAIVWFRNDLRLGDNPALQAAVTGGGPALQAAVTGGAVFPLFILEEEEAADFHPMGAAARWRLHQGLAALAADLAAKGSKLILRRGRPAKILPQLAAQTGAGAVYWNRRYEPSAITRDRGLKTALKESGLTVETFNGGLLFEPWEIVTRSAGPYRVFSPYWRACRTAAEPTAPLPAPERLPPVPADIASDRLEDWDLTPGKPDWAAEMREVWDAGEAAATARTVDFLGAALTDYAHSRDIPGVEGVSRLSPYLHFGEISPRQVWSATRAKSAACPEAASGAEAFLRELGWREFSHHLLYHFPEIPEQPFNGKYARFPWRDDPAGLAAWRRGLTGYPIVDAGMRQLWRTGWMHNRVRMIAASFLVKDLLVSWREGAAWFWDTLIDADLANNSASWQWVAGCGADAAPYFRIFNPVTQGEKFDPQGAYVRRWVPELAALPDRWIHQPWEAPALVREAAGVRLGTTYPAPIVDHAAARDRALAALMTLRG